MMMFYVVLLIALLGFVFTANENDTIYLPVVLPASTPSGLTEREHGNDMRSKTDNRVITTLRKIHAWRTANTGEMAEAVLDGPWRKTTLLADATEKFSIDHNGSSNDTDDDDSDDGNDNDDKVRGSYPVPLFHWL